MEIINRVRVLEIYFRCYKLGYIGVSLLDEKGGIGVGIIFFIGFFVR